MRVPGHRGGKGNILGDDLARIVAKIAPVGPDPTVGIYESLIKRKLRNLTVEWHYWKWEIAEWCRQTKVFSIWTERRRRSWWLVSLVAVIFDTHCTNAKSHQILIVTSATRTNKQLPISYVTFQSSWKEASSLGPSFPWGVGNCYPTHPKCVLFLEWSLWELR